MGAVVDEGEGVFVGDEAVGDDEEAVVDGAEVFDAEEALVVLVVVAGFVHNRSDGGRNLPLRRSVW